MARRLSLLSVCFFFLVPLPAAGTPPTSQQGEPPAVNASQVNESIPESDTHEQVLHVLLNEWMRDPYIYLHADGNPTPEDQKQIAELNRTGVPAGREGKKPWDK